MKCNGWALSQKRRQEPLGCYWSPGASFSMKSSQPYHKRQEHALEYPKGEAPCPRPPCLKWLVGWHFGRPNLVKWVQVHIKKSGGHALCIWGFESCHFGGLGAPFLRSWVIILMPVCWSRVTGDAQQDTLEPRSWFFSIFDRFWAPLGTHLDVRCSDVLKA